jgi:penicillin-binding protein 2
VAAFDLENDEIIVVARDITRDQVLAVKDAALPGVFVEDDYKRYYPYREVAHMMGYVGQSSENARIHGRTGIEAAYNEQLDGTDGKKILHTNAVGEEQGFAVVEKATIGNDVHTTIDLTFQQYFHERFLEGLATLGRTAGLGLAMNPQTGEVLAMMSFPDYDPNAIADYFTEPEQPLFNRAVSGTYNPASTIKIFHAAAALHEGVIAPTKQIYSAGYIELPNPYFPDNPSRFVDWKPHGWVDVRSALARSSNVYFYEVIGGFESQRGVGIERLRTYWNAFGFGRRTNIDIPGEATGFLPSPAEKEARTGNPWRIGDTYNISIGQGDLLLTPIQLITGVSAVLNGGTLYEPYINQEKGPVVAGDISHMEDALREVREGMRDGASETYGTSYLLHDLPVEVLAKTGSAQVSNKTKTNALFVGAIPADDPELVILILIEDAKVGSINTLPTAKDVLRWYYENRIEENTALPNDSEAK